MFNIFILDEATLFKGASMKNKTHKFFPKMLQPSTNFYVQIS